MKQSIIIFFLITGAFQLKAQDWVEENEMVGFGCYYSGTQSKTVKKVTSKLLNKNYNSISKMLNSENNAERYMAVITLEKLSELNRFDLTEEQRLVISEIKNSEELVSVCSGCTYFNKVTLKSMFSKEMKLFAQNWLRYNFKTD